MKVYNPIFWGKKSLLAYLLLPLSLITFFINQSKKMLNKKKFKIKTICVGNIYLGGTGKTSLAIEIYKILSKNYNPVFIKKKYQHHIDEINQLKNSGNIIFNKNREDSLSLALKKKFDVAILDDGLQQKNLYFDFSIACFNSKNGLGNRFLIPSGPLRENLSEIKNYDTIFINGENNNNSLKKELRKIKNKIHIFEAKYKPINLKKLNLKKNYLMFSGIGNPHEFEKTLLKYKFKISKRIIFPDHYKLNKSEINEIKKMAKSKNLNIITTEKDFNRLDANQKKNIKCLKIKLDIKNIKKFKKILLEKL